jgi:hypothetical protein
MTPDEQEEIKRFFRRWSEASVVLDAERHARLRAMTDDECRAAIADLLSLPWPDMPERGSGLVEQQRLFRRLA